MDKIIEEGVSKLKRDLLTYPVETSKKRIKRTIKNLLGHGEAAPDRFFWPHAMMAQALWQYYGASGEESVLSLLEKYYNKHKRDIQNIKYPDTVMNGYTLIDLYEKTGNEEYGLVLESMAQYLKTAPKAKDGSILYRANQKEVVYADTIGMIVPFMCRYGAKTGDQELQELAIKQVVNFTQSGMDVESGLPYHAYNADTKEKQGIIGWGRAVGWIFMGIADGANYLDDNQKARLTEGLDELIEATIKYQREDGLFSWQLQAIGGPEDISATGMILSAIKILLDQGLINDNYKKIIDKGLIAIKEQSEAYKKCLAECKALSCYPQVYGEYPWGTAAIVKMLDMFK